MRKKIKEEEFIVSVLDKIFKSRVLKKQVNELNEKISSLVDNIGELEHKIVLTKQEAQMNISSQIREEKINSQSSELKNFWDKYFESNVNGSLKEHITQSLRNNSNESLVMDSDENCNYATNGYGFWNNQVYQYFSSNFFIGFEQCAILSQHWLINKACLVPAQDAIRNWFDITHNEGVKIDKNLIENLKEYDAEFKLKENLKDFIFKSRIFGIRLAYYVVDFGDDRKNKEFYENPFNIDAITPGSYRGICQVDPYYVTPDFDIKSASDPSYMYFLEPTWWRIAGGMRIHRTHCAILRTQELPDIIKPMYRYGGMPIPQLIAEKVYNSERVASDAVLLVETKRTDVWFCNMQAALQNQNDFDRRVKDYIYNRNSQGIKVMDIDERMEQFDTSLTDVVSVQMMELQLVAAASNVIATKLLETSPQGFNSGEYEEQSYRRGMETIQSQVTFMVERHHELVIKSYIEPKTGESFKTFIVWNKLDSLTQKEVAEINLIKAQTGQVLMQSGAIDGQDERSRIAHDESSEYSSIDEDREIEVDLEEDFDEKGF